ALRGSHLRPGGCSPFALITPERSCNAAAQRYCGPSAARRQPPPCAATANGEDGPDYQQEENFCRRRTASLDPPGPWIQWMATHDADVGSASHRGPTIRADPP